MGKENFRNHICWVTGNGRGLISLNYSTLYKCEPNLVRELSSDSISCHVKNISYAGDMELQSALVCALLKVVGVTSENYAASHSVSCYVSKI